MRNSGRHQQAREAQRVHDDGQEGKSDAGSATTVHVLRKRSRPKDSRSSGDLLAPRATTAHPLLCSVLTSNRIWHDSGHNGVNCCLYLLVALLLFDWSISCIVPMVDPLSFQCTARRATTPCQ